MALYDYIGIVEEVGQTQAIGANGFTKRDIIIGNDITSDNRFPNPVKFTFKKANTSLLDNIQKDQRVKIHFAIEGRRWDGGTRGTQYFVDLTGLKIEVLNPDGTSVEPVAQPGAPAAAPVAAAPAPAAPASVSSEFIDDVPF